MKVEVRTGSINAYVEIEQFQEEMAQQGKYGATSVFIGSMRDQNEGESIESMELEHYPGMTEKHLTSIVESAMRQWPLLDVLLLHRVGPIHISEPIVVIAVWSAHRAAAFEACRFIIEDLKRKAPFWKKETTTTGQRWVESNTPG